MDIYDQIVEGFRHRLPKTTTIEVYLQSLKPFVKQLRSAYRGIFPSVEYANKNIQAAYLIAYLPHYYQLIYKILIEQVPDIFRNHREVNLTFIGGGPGSEAYGVVKYIANNCATIKTINITILDINASGWGFSHNIVEEQLISPITKNKIRVKWVAQQFNLINNDGMAGTIPLIACSHLVVIQNCLNEIMLTHRPQLQRNIEILLKNLSEDSFLIIADLTSSVRTLLQNLEKALDEKFKPHLIKTTLSQKQGGSLMSFHSKPSSLIQKHLMDYTDGLIPRKWLNYDYTIISKGASEQETDKALGFNALYKPLDFRYLDANNFTNSKTFIGIDFGTSTSVVSYAILVNKRIEIKTIPIPQKDHMGETSNGPLVPTVISIAENQMMIGKHAADHKAFLQEGKSCWHSFKQNLPSLKNKKYPNSLLKDHPKYKISNGEEALIAFFKYLLEGIHQYLQSQKLPADLAFAISVPAGSSSEEKQILKFCLEKAGIHCVDSPYIEEPNAALINYLFEKNINVAKAQQKNILVLDIGAGTVDCSIIKMDIDSEGLNSELVSIKRLGEIGSNLADKLIAALLLKKNKVTRELTSDEQIILYHKCEQLKIKICKNIPIDATVAFELNITSRSDNEEKIDNVEKLNKLGIKELKLSYKEFSEIMRDYWKGTNNNPGIETTIHEAITHANLSKTLINNVILTGGGVRNPYIKNFVATLFGADKIVIPDNIQEHVARGAALHSFVLNSFGKNIITPILGESYSIQGKNKSIVLFSAGESIPTIDFEVFIEQSILFHKSYIYSYYGGPNNNGKYFEIPEGLEIIKLVFYVNPDQDLKCDIIGKEYSRTTTELYNISTSYLIPLK